MKQTGKFYGIGVGPGDPELMTLKAVRRIRECDIVVLPVSNRELAEPLLLEQNEVEVENRAAGYLESCTAYQIAVQTVSKLKEKQILFLPMPMIKDKEKLRKIHAQGAEAIEQLLEKGWNLAFLTLGDPTVYSTCMYVEQMMEQDGYQVETVSGIPSFCAVAARLNQPLGEQEEQIHILPGSYEAGEGLQLSGTKILMKTGKKMGQIKEFLQGSSQDICLVENCGMDKERIVRSVEEISEDMGYYSLLIVKDKKKQ